MRPLFEYENGTGHGKGGGVFYPKRVSEKTEGISVENDANVGDYAV
jgi:hypothetical protein